MLLVELFRSVKGVENNGDELVPGGSAGDRAPGICWYYGAMTTIGRARGWGKKLVLARVVETRRFALDGCLVMKGADLAE
jgi:hypothetical protein